MGAPAWAWRPCGRTSSRRGQVSRQLRDARRTEREEDEGDHRRLERSSPPRAESLVLSVLSALTAQGLCVFGCEEPGYFFGTSTSTFASFLTAHDAVTQGAA